MEFLPLAMAGSLLWKAIDFLKALRAKDQNKIATQVIAWGAGVGVLFLVASTQFASEISVGKLSLAHLDGPTKLFVGLMLSSVTGVAYDVKKALDNTDSASQPSLLPPA